ncbi:hypothetical protein EDD85DRAFT_940198 [Armillaria nabsnona]|nr:hypothetical protein EDD85DRAFT_940198 [Armillaria nabsnona]
MSNDAGLNLLFDFAIPSRTSYNASEQCCEMGGMAIKIQDPPRHAQEFHVFGVRERVIWTWSQTMVNEGLDDAFMAGLWLFRRSREVCKTQFMTKSESSLIISENAPDSVTCASSLNDIAAISSTTTTEVHLRMGAKTYLVPFKNSRPEVKYYGSTVTAGRSTRAEKFLTISLRATHIYAIGDHRAGTQKQYDIQQYVDDASDLSTDTATHTCILKLHLFSAKHSMRWISLITTGYITLTVLDCSHFGVDHMRRPADSGSSGGTRFEYFCIEASPKASIIVVLHHTLMMPRPHLLMKKRVVCHTCGGFVPGKAEMEREIKRLEKRERRLTARYKMVFPWKIDSVAVFNEAKARAFSKRNKQSEEDLRKLSKLHSLRCRGVEESRRVFHAERALVV